jgi:hypothetical protein
MTPAEHRGTCAGNVNKLFSHETSEHARYQLGQQVHAHGRHRLQPEEDDEIQIQQTDG